MPKNKWQLQEVKSQQIDYRKLTRPGGKLVDFFRKSPLAGIDLKLTRDKDTGRNSPKS